MPNGIRSVEVQLGEDRERQEVTVMFGPHHGLKIFEEGDQVRFRLVATHHGFDAAATGELPTELEEVINMIRKERDDLVIDRFEIQNE